jgi:hypothetical protein
MRTVFVAGRTGLRNKVLEILVFLNNLLGKSYAVRFHE